MRKTDTEKFVVEGLGKTYKVESTSHDASRTEAARRFKRQTRAEEPVMFLRRYFSSSKVKKARPGPKLKVIGGNNGTGL